VVTLVYRLAEVLDGPRGAINRFYGNNTRTLLIISVVATLYWLWDQRRRGRTELQSISTIEKELEGDEVPASDKTPEAPPPDAGKEGNGEGRSGSAGRPEHR
jgi:uncharacterized protein YjiS (DUF1127 family)